MNVTLESNTAPKQLRMCDLKPGQIAEIIGGENTEYIGRIICIDYTGRIAFTIGENGDTWTGLVSTPVRLLTPGEKIVIGK